MRAAAAAQQPRASTQIASIATLTRREKEELLSILTAKEEKARITAAKNDLLEFARQIYPSYAIGPHHKALAKLLQDISTGKETRIIVNVAPRFGKSLLTSHLFPAWYLGHHPEHKLITATHTASLSELFGRQVRNTIASPEYQEIFPGTSMAEDSKSAGAWNTSADGSFYAVGVGGALAGRGADLLVIDDPHALPLDTQVPTSQGFRTIGELEVGDCVYGPDGLPTRVLAKSEVLQDRELFAVTTDDNEVVYCDGGHLWAYHSETALSKAHLVKTATARDLAAWSKPNKPYLPRHAPVAYPHAQLPMDPYILGAWLGDGTSSLGRMTAHPDDAPFMREQFARAGYIVTEHADRYSFGVLALREQLRNMGVLNNKHIPEAYLHASIEQRMALLQGLMDTDGDVTEAGQCSFNNTNESLTAATQELVHSLGVKASVHRYDDSREGCNPVYRVTFRLKDAARMPRKRVRTFTPTDKRRRSFVVTRTGLRSAVQCITVDRKDGQFLVGRGYVVTHNSEQDGRSNSRISFDQAWEWYQTGPRQRLQWGGRIVVVATRWSMLDLTGRLLEHQARNPDADQWKVVEFPAILNEGEPNAKSLWPEKWPLEELLKAKASMDPRYWNSQYQQDPTSEANAIIKREWWRMWLGEEPPDCQFIIQVWDTAYEAKTSADFCACITLGVWKNDEDKGRNHLILLDAFRDRMEFPELKKTAFEHWTDWKPDAFIIEKKAAGAPLIQELRQMGIPVSEFTPSRGNDKMTRVNAITDIFASGMVWSPDTRWAKEVIEECAAFPVSAHDDYVDCISSGLLRFRQGRFVELESDWQDEPKMFRSSRFAGYY